MVVFLRTKDQAFIRRETISLLSSFTARTVQRQLDIYLAGVRGRIDLDSFINLIDENTRLVSISAVQYGSGFRADLERIGRAVRKVDALFVVDIIQGFGAMGFDLPAQYVEDYSEPLAIDIARAARAAAGASHALAVLIHLDEV